MAAKFFEDFDVGQRMTTGVASVTQEAIHRFASEYDPQPIHLDRAAADAGFFGQRVGSGWHVAVLTMKLMVEAKVLGDTPLIGVEIHNMRFAAPLLPEDRITAEAVVLAKRESTRPGRGYLRFEVITRRQDESEIMTQEWTMVVPRHGASTSRQEGLLSSSCCLE